MSAHNRHQLVESLKQHLHARPEILEAYLFGSLSRGQAQSHSDVDVAVYVDPVGLPDSPFGYAAELTAALATALGSDAVDLVVLNQAPPLPSTTWPRWASFPPASHTGFAAWPVSGT